MIFLPSYLHSIIYAQYLTEHHVESTKLSIVKARAFPDLKTFGLGASLSGDRFSTIQGVLVNEVTINRDVKVSGSIIRGGYSNSIHAEKYFILNSHKLVKLRK